MINDYELDGFALGQHVKDVVDGFDGVITGLVVHRFNAPEAKVEEQHVEGKVHWRPLGRLEHYDAKGMGFTEER